MGLLDFFSREAGQQRRQWLDDNVGDFMTYITPPNLRPAASMAAQMNPVQGMANSMQAANVAFDPKQTAEARRRAALDMGVEMAMVLTPTALASRGYMTPAVAAMEGLLGGSPTTAQIGESAGNLTADAIGAYHSARSGDLGGVLDAFAPSRPAQSLSAGSVFSPEERIAFSTPASWLDPKYERPQWHPISEASMITPASEVVPQFEAVGTLSPEKSLSIEDLQGRVITPAYGDRTVAGVNVLGYDDVVYDAPVRSQGGRDFMREEGTGLWASERKPMAAKSKLINQLLDAGEDPALVYTAMGAQSGDFSTIMMEAALNQFDPKKISADAAKKFDDRMASLGIKSWPGTKSGKVEEAMRNMPGSTRWVVWQEMDKAGYRNAGFPDIGLTRVSITDPELLNVDPFASGLNVGRPTGLLSSEAFIPHPSYSHQIGGEYEGSMGNLPGQLVWRDFFENRRAIGKAPGGDQRAFMMSSPQITQRVDQQMVDEINDWLMRQEQAQ